MFLHLLALAGLGAGSGSALGQPTISGLIVSPNAGTCPSSGGHDIGPAVEPTASAHIDLSWNISFFNDAQYEIHVSENGAAPFTQPTTDTTYIRGVAGLVENAPLFQTYKEFSWAVMLVRKSDGAVLQTLTGTYAADYGRCVG